MENELIVLTRSQLEEVIEKTIKKTLDRDQSVEVSKILFGVKQIADYLGISVSTCHRYIKEGVFGDAIFYIGRSVRAYSDRVLDRIIEHQDERYVHQFHNLPRKSS